MINDRDRQEAIKAGQSLAYQGIQATARILAEVPDEELAAYVNDTAPAIDTASTPAAVIACAHQHYRYKYEQMRREGNL
jgi:hypothetical protein